MSKEFLWAKKLENNYLFYFFSKSLLPLTSESKFVFHTIHRFYEPPVAKYSPEALKDTAPTSLSLEYKV